MRRLRGSIAATAARRVHRLRLVKTAEGWPIKERFMKHLIATVMFAGFVIGCGQQPAPAPAPKPGGINVNVPGVNVTVDPQGGTKVTAPGVNVEADSKGAKVNAPNVNVDVPQPEVKVEGK